MLLPPGMTSPHEILSAYAPLTLHALHVDAHCFLNCAHWLPDVKLLGFPGRNALTVGSSFCSLPAFVVSDSPGSFVNCFARSVRFL